MSDREIIIMTETRLRELIREELRAVVRPTEDLGFLEIEEAARILGVTARTLAAWARREVVPACKVGRRWKFQRADIAASIAGSKRRADHGGNDEG